MVSTWSTAKSYELMGNADQAGTWGNETNINLQRIDNNLGGVYSINITGTGNIVLTPANAQNLIYKVTGYPGSNTEVDIIWPAGGVVGPPAYNGTQGFFIVQNNCTTPFPLFAVNAAAPTIKIPIPQGPSTSSPQTATTVVYSDGTNMYLATAPNVYPLVGQIIDYAGKSTSTLPMGWFPCDGGTMSSSAYPELYNAIGTMWGGTTANFARPDFRGYVSAGYDNLGTNTVLTGANGNNVSATSFASIGGEQGHALQQGEVAAHYHDFTHTHTPASAGITGAQFWIQTSSGAPGANASLSSVSGKVSRIYPNSGPASTTTTNSGNGLPNTPYHNNVQPTRIIWKIIYAGRA